MSIFVWLYWPYKVITDTGYTVSEVVKLGHMKNVDKIYVCDYFIKIHSSM